MIIQKSLIFVAIWIFFSALGQIVMKKGLTGTHNLSVITSFADLFHFIIAYRYLMLGCAIYATSIFVYFIVLSKYDIHLASSIGGGLMIVLISLFAVFLLGEKIFPLTWVGILLVVVGVCLIGISKQSP